MPVDVAILAYPRHQRPLDLGAGGVAAGVQHTPP